MDRRRFSPRAEGLDDRVLLSGMHAPTSAPVANLHQKTVRIDNLGKVLDSLQPNLVVPKEIVGPIQLDLKGLVGKLNPANSNALVAVELQFRGVIDQASISTEDVAALNSTFVSAIESTGAPQAITDDLQANMTKLVQFDSTQSNPAILAANDYAVVLQTVLGVGRPIRTPTAPSLSPTDDSGPKGDHATTVTQPHFVGHYDTGSTVQLLDENYDVIATGTVTAAGAYSLAPATPLSYGKHVIRVQAIDANGDHSKPGLPFTINIKAPRHPATTSAAGTSGGSLGL